MPKFYKVVARGGHWGAGKYAELIFYIKAKDALSASQQVKKMPCVKHSNPYAIISVSEITQDEYIDKRQNGSAYDIYKEKQI